MYKIERPCYTPMRKTASFSATLLEAIYRSIDETEGRDLCSAFYDQGFTVTAREQSSRWDYDCNDASSASLAGRRRFSSLTRIIMIEEWMEKQSSGARGCSSSRSNSVSLSSGSTSGGKTGAYSFSSYETESDQHKSRLPDYEARLKTKKNGSNGDFGGGLSRTKLRVRKIYDELKKVKEPISPGGKISAFLSSIFNSRNVKKAKMCYVGAVDDISSFDHKAASSFSVSARNFPTNDSSTKQPNRSPKYYPSQVFPDNNCLAVPRRCSSCKEKDFALNRVSSCSSSDLFELDDHLMGRLGEESVVYETTTFKKNQAIIAHGFCSL